MPALPAVKDESLGVTVAYLGEELSISLQAGDVFIASASSQSIDGDEVADAMYEEAKRRFYGGPRREQGLSCNISGQLKFPLRPFRQFIECRGAEMLVGGLLGVQDRLRDLVLDRGAPGCLQCGLPGKLLNLDIFVERACGFAAPGAGVILCQLPQGELFPELISLGPISRAVVHGRLVSYEGQKDVEWLVLQSFERAGMRQRLEVPAEEWLRQRGVRAAVGVVHGKDKPVHIVAEGFFGWSCPHCLKILNESEIEARFLNGESFGQLCSKSLGDLSQVGLDALAAIATSFGLGAVRLNDRFRDLPLQERSLLGALRVAHAGLHDSLIVLDRLPGREGASLRKCVAEFFSKQGSAVFLSPAQDDCGNTWNEGVETPSSGALVLRAGDQIIASWPYRWGSVVRHEVQSASVRRWLATAATEKEEGVFHFEAGRGIQLSRVRSALAEIPRGETLAAASGLHAALVNLYKGSRGALQRGLLARDFDPLRSRYRCQNCVGRGVSEDLSEAFGCPVCGGGRLGAPLDECLAGLLPFPKVYGTTVRDIGERFWQEDEISHRCKLLDDAGLGKQTLGASLRLLSLSQRQVAYWTDILSGAPPKRALSRIMVGFHSELCLTPTHRAWLLEACKLQLLSRDAVVMLE